MKKQSRYNIWVGNILYNSFTDQLIQFKTNEIDNISYFLNHLEEFESDYPELLSKFENKGFVIKSHIDELDNIVFQNRKAVFLDRHYHLTINPTLECNYHCWYCCVEAEGTKYERRRMDDKTIQIVKKHIQYAVDKERVNSLFIDWFGGEPLMYFKEVIYPIAEYASELCNKKKIPYSNHITTNAYYLDNSMIEAFKKIQVNSFQIPIDGSEKKHNSVKNMNNIGHYWQIVQNINTLCETMDNITIVLRINYDSQTLKTILPVIDHIIPSNRKNITVDFQRVWQIDLNRDEKGNNVLLLETKRAFEKAGFNTMYFAFKHKTNKCCYSDNFYHRVINYDGKIFKCTAYDYPDDLVIGSFNEDGSITINEEIVSKMFSDPPFKNEKCLSCIKLPLCYGPCVQKYYDTKIGKMSFLCSYDFSEISLEEYIKDKALQQLEK